MSTFIEAPPGTIKIRASTTTSLLDCELRGAGVTLARLFKEHGFELPPGSATIGALVGSAVHGGAEVGLTEKMQAGTVAPLSTMEDAGIETFRGRRHDEAMEGVIWDPESTSYDVAERQIRRMVSQYREDVVRVSRPLAVESRLEAEIMPGVILSGQADLLHLHSDPGDNRLRDLKTGRMREPPKKHMAQMGCYSLLFRSKGLKVDSGQIDFLQRKKLASVQPQVEEQPFDVLAAEQVAWSVLQNFADKAVAFARDGDPRRFVPNPTSRLCSARYCRLFGTAACSATRGLRRE